MIHLKVKIELNEKKLTCLIYPYKRTAKGVENRRERPSSLTLSMLGARRG